jgi:prepilin-type N-terminal cleavage/methylation domain-containing protein
MVRSGFTLIELMAVIIIVAILSGALAPSMVASLRRAGAKAAASKTAALLDFAYAAAISRRQEVIVNFDEDRRSCWLSVQNTALPWVSEMEHAQTAALADLSLPRNVEMSLYRTGEVQHLPGKVQDQESFPFRPDGTADDIVIEFSDGSDELWQVRVIGATGEVVIQERR